MSDVRSTWRTPTRRRFRTWLGSTWKLAGWPVVATLTVAAVVLGFVGFREYYQQLDAPKSITDLLYRSLQLFVLESGSVPPTDAPWTLEIARLLAPAVTGAALVAAAVTVFRQEVDELRLRRRKDHVVVCGLGTRGSRLAKVLQREGYQVVVVEQDAGAPAVDELRRLGVPVVVGNARNPDTLRRARVGRASHVIALTGSDDANAEIALRSTGLASSRKGPAVTCLAHVGDPELCLLLRSEELARGRRGGLRLDLFNLYDQGARTLLDDHPPFRDGDRGSPHLVVVGLNHFGQSLVAEVARRWRALSPASGRTLDVSVLDPQAERMIELLSLRYPLLARVVRLRPIAADIGSICCEIFGEGVPPTVVYVCIDDDLICLEVALKAIACPGTGSAPVVAQLDRAAGLAGLLDRHGARGRLFAFDLLERTLRSELLLGGTYEVLARAIHEEYRAGRLAQGVDPERDPSMAPWEELSGSLKESNRDQASHIGVKLAAIGWGIAPLTDWAADRLEFEPGDVEILARMEHDRWVAERTREGWRLGPKDVGTRTTPYLVPWEHLSEEVRELDRRTVRHIPALVVQAGYQVGPVPDATGGGPDHVPTAAAP